VSTRRHHAHTTVGWGLPMNASLTPECVATRILHVEPGKWRTFCHLRQSFTVCLHNITLRLRNRHERALNANRTHGRRPERAYLGTLDPHT
jgi:hypothetical protein